MVDCMPDQKKHCGGNNDDNSFRFMIENGVLLFDDSPYFGFTQKCKKNLFNYTYKIVKSYKTNENNPSVTFDELISKGAVTASMNIGTMEFKGYRPKPGGHVPSLQGVGCPDPKKRGHKVLIVAQIIEGGKTYLIAKNSWGTTWGDGGYFKIPKYSECAIIIKSTNSLPLVYDGPIPKSHPPKPKKKAAFCVKYYTEEVKL